MATFVRSIAAAFLAVSMVATSGVVHAAARWWDAISPATSPADGGNGTWTDTASFSNWRTAQTGGSQASYSGTQQAAFPVIAGSGTYTVTVSGTVQISGASTTYGLAGIAAASGAGNFAYAFEGTGVSPTIQLTAAAYIHANSGTAFSGNLTINTNGQDLTFSNGAAVSSLISGSGTLTKGGGGTVTLSNDSNSYTGATTLSQGTLSFTSIRNVGGGASALGAPTTVANGTIAMGSGVLGGTMRYTGTTDSSSNRTFSLAGTTVGNTIEVFSTGNLTITTSNTAVAGAKTLTLQGSSTGVGQFTAPVVNSSGTIALTKNGTGTWILSGNNTYTGATTINAGTLQIGNGDGTGTLSTSSAISNSGTLAFNRTGMVTQGTNFGNISGTGLVANDGTGTLVLGTGSTYTGGTRVTAGTLQMASGATVLGSANGTLTVNGGLVDMNNNSLTVGNLTGAGGTISGASGARTLTIGSGDFGGGNFVGIIADGAGGTTALTKIGNGTITLSGNNTYTGVTAVNAGLLLINGSTVAASGLTVGLGGTLGGNGTINGATTVNGTLLPGNSPGVLSFNSTLTLNGTTNLEIDGVATRGTDFDGVNTGGLLTYGGGLTLDFGTTFSGNQTWDLFSIGGSETGNFTSVALTGNYSGSLTNNGSGVWELTDGGGNAWSFSQASGDLTFIAVPEPATIALLGAGVAILGVHLARRRKA